MSEKEDREASPAEELKKAAEAAETGAAAGGAAPGGDVSAELEAARKQAAESFDLYVRAVAEMENTRRRCAEDVVKAQKFAIDKFARNILPVVDSLEKAVEAAAGADKPVREGIEITLRQMVHALEVSGMKCIDPVGEKFDPASQQAIAMVPAGEGQKPGTVAQVFQRGWLLNGRVLRAAMVSVIQG